MTDLSPSSGQPPELPAQEAANMRRGMIFLVLFAFFFVLSVWGATTLLSDITAPEPVSRDFSTELLGLHRAFTGPGVTPFQSSDREALARWLQGQVGAHARVPDLVPAGLVASGVRKLEFGGGGLGMIRYRDTTDASRDVIAVFAPQGRMGVPAHAAERTVGGRAVWLQTENTARLAYAAGHELDWVLVSGREEPALLEAMKTLLWYDSGARPSGPANNE